MKSFTAEKKEQSAEGRRESISENEITDKIIGCAIKVHKNLGPGLLESAYEECLFYELTKYDLFIEKQKALPLIYEEVKLECGYRADLLVNKRVVVEVKSVDALNDIHLAQGINIFKII